MKIRFSSVILLAGLCGFYACADEPTTLSKKSSDDLATTYNKKFGVGVIVGEPTGASVKYWLNDTLALDGAAGWSFHEHTDFYLHSDLLLHRFDLIPVSKGRMPLYFGAGGLIRFHDDNRDNEVGIRVPVGVAYMFDDMPVDIFAEIVPAVDVSPDVQGEITGGIGIRYWF